ncbi:MAG: chromate resistance protein [Desulfarculus sp.]|nr:chromate resistance protein [Desulfarculus sp.]
MRWVTRSRLHVDRVACPWLIRRFVDSQAEFVFVPKAEVLRVAEEQGAIAFDSPGAPLHHQGDRCTFDAIIDRYGLDDPALLRLAEIVRAADTDRLDQHPVAAGLEAVAKGFGLVCPDDAENLARQMAVYDALYAWCRLQVAAEATKP